MDRKTWLFVVAALSLSLALAAFVSPFASAAPDGLDKFTEEHGLAEQTARREVWTRAPMADYKVGRIRNERLSTGVAGAAGTLAVFGAALGLAQVIRRRKANES
jgi:hypothetical protein